MSLAHRSPVLRTPFCPSCLLVTELTRRIYFRSVVIWKDFKTVIKIEVHEQAVWAIRFVGEDRLLTGMISLATPMALLMRRPISQLRQTRRSSFTLLMFEVARPISCRSTRVILNLYEDLVSGLTARVSGVVGMTGQ